MIFLRKNLDHSMCSELRYPGNKMVSKDVIPTRMRVKDLRAICDWTQKRKKENAGISTREFPLKESPSKNIWYRVVRNFYAFSSPESLVALSRLGLVRQKQVALEHIISLDTIKQRESTQIVRFKMCSQTGSLKRFMWLMVCCCRPDPSPRASGPAEQLWERDLLSRLAPFWCYQTTHYCYQPITFEQTPLNGSLSN